MTTSTINYEKYYNNLRYKLSLPFKRMYLRRALNQGKLVKVNYKYRCVGKTSLLIEKSLKDSIPIVVSSQYQADYLRERGVKDVVRLANGYTIEITGKTFENGLLIEESVKEELLEVIRKNNIEIRGGFIAVED